MQVMKSESCAANDARQGEQGRYGDTNKHRKDNSILVNEGSR